MNRILKGLFCGVILLTSAVSLAEEKPVKIRWVLAHEPARVFRRAAQHFADTVAQKSGNRVQVEILEANSINKNSVITPAGAFKMLQAGELEMSQTYTTSLGQYNKDMWVVDLPFLFRNHEHAAKVLDGQIGQRIVAGLETSGVKGLGFTYSGGYRVIPSKSAPLTKVDDFKGKKIRVTKDSPIAASYMKELGAVPMQVDAENFKGKLDAFETTYARLDSVKNNDAKFINETEHSLFLTTIIINKKFFESLPADLQKIVSESAKETAALERADSIKDNLENKEKYKAQGIQIVDMPADQVEKMKQKASGVYKQYEGFFAPGLVADIQNTK